MKRFLFLYLALLLIAPRMRAEPVDYVSVLMGTDSSRDFSAGNTYPAIALPWGMNAWTPVTGKMGSGWQYTYNARIIYGFKQTHQPSPWINDYGQFEVMATCGKPVFSEDKRIAAISEERIIQSMEVAKASGATSVIFHSNMEPFLTADAYRNNWLDKNEVVFRRICEKYPSMNGLIIG